MKKITILTLALFVLSACSSSNSGEDSDESRFEVINGNCYYDLADDSILSESEDNSEDNANHNMRVGELTNIYFKTFDEFKETVKNKSFDAHDKSIMAKSFPRDENGIIVCRDDVFYKPYLPLENFNEATKIDWAGGESYALYIQNNVDQKGINLLYFNNSKQKLDETLRRYSYIYNMNGNTSIENLSAKYNNIEILKYEIYEEDGIKYTIFNYATGSSSRVSGSYRWQSIRWEFEKDGIAYDSLIEYVTKERVEDNTENIEYKINNICILATEGEHSWYASAYDVPMELSRELITSFKLIKEY